MPSGKTSLSTPKVVENLIGALDSKIFKALSEPVRADILKYLLLNGRSDIATIAENLPQDRSVISRHLSILADAGILKAAKETRHVFYDINGTAFLNYFEEIVDNLKKFMSQCCMNESDTR